MREVLRANRIHRMDFDDSVSGQGHKSSTVAESDEWLHICTTDFASSVNGMQSACGQ